MVGYAPITPSAALPYDISVMMAMVPPMRAPVAKIPVPVVVVARAGDNYWPRASHVRCRSDIGWLRRRRRGRRGTPDEKGEAAEAEQTRQCVAFHGWPSDSLFYLPHRGT